MGGGDAGDRGEKRLSSKKTPKSRQPSCWFESISRLNPGQVRPRSNPKWVAKRRESEKVSERNRKV